MISLPCASSALARASTSNAVSVPSCPILCANFIKSPARIPMASATGRKRRLLSVLRYCCLPGVEHLPYTILMNKTLTRTICSKLDVDGHDAALATTQRAFNAAATWIAQICWDEGIANTNTAHHRVYGETRLNFGLGAQLAVCARAKAVEALKAVKAVKAKHREQATCPRFGPRGSIRYDART